MLWLWGQRGCDQLDAGIEGLDFIESVRRLADLAGLQLPDSKPEDAAQAARRRTALDILEAGCRFFEASLQKDSAAEARSYLARRGLDSETITSFRIGYAPLFWPASRPAAAQF